MKTLVVTLAAVMVIALTGCGVSTPSALLTYVARSNGSAPQLYTLDPTTKKATAVAIPIPASAYYVSANANATVVVYTRYGASSADIFRMGKDGKEQQLTTGMYAYAPAFSPDGKTIAYFAYPSGGNEAIYTMNADGSNQKVLYGAGTSYQYYPEFSPDGKSVVFYRSGVSGQPNGWYTMALTATTPTLVYATSNWWGPAVFSADGKKLLLTTYLGTGYDNVSSVNLDGTGLVSLTPGTSTTDFSPVPYRNVILFNRYNSANSSWDIYVMDQTGANQLLVSSTASTYESLIDTYWSGN